MATKISASILAAGIAAEFSSRLHQEMTKVDDSVLNTYVVDLFEETRNAADRIARLARGEKIDGKNGQREEVRAHEVLRRLHGRRRSSATPLDL